MMKSNAVVVEKNLTRDEDMALRNLLRIMDMFLRYTTNKVRVKHNLTCHMFLFRFDFTFDHRFGSKIAEEQDPKQEGEVFETVCALLCTYTFLSLYIII